MIYTVFLVGHADAFQQVAGPIVYELQPGEEKTMKWGLISDSDDPTTISFRVEGSGSELVHLPDTMKMNPRGSVGVDVRVSVPSDYQNDILLKPAIYATQLGESGGQTTINIAMKKVLTIKIGNPTETEIEQKSTAAKPSEGPTTSEQPGTGEPPAQKKIKPGQQLVINTEEAPKESERPCAPGTVRENGQCVPVKESSQGGGCLIATASFGSELAPQVQALREVRDSIVFGTYGGGAFMSAFNTVYYSFSPTVSDWERQSPALKEAVRIAITPMVSSLSILNLVDIDSQYRMLGYGIGIVLLNVGMYLVAPAIGIRYLLRRLR